MRQIGIVTDSNSGISPELASSLGITVLPMSFFVDGKEYFENVDLSQEDFFRMMQEDNVDVSTTQPSPDAIRRVWDNVLKENDALVYIPMSSGLSASCGTATALAKQYDGRVEVVNNHRISVTQYQSVLDALTLANAGHSAREIRSKLEEESFESSIYIMVDTLDYLKHGGRITPAAAMIGSVLHLKPVLQIQGDKLDSYAKTRGEKAARHAMLNAIREDVEGRFHPYAEKDELVYHYSWSYTEDKTRITSWQEEICHEFGLSEIEGMPLALSISCHTGPGCLAVTCSHRILPDF